MEKSKFTNEQITFTLKQAETGAPVREVVRKMDITETTFYRWRRKNGALGAMELRRQDSSRKRTGS